MSANGHTPVLLDETLSYLDAGREGTYIDCTLGLGGHALEILTKNPLAKIIGFDVDELSLRQAKKRLAPFADRLTLYQADFRFLPDLEIDFGQIRGVLLDLGISSFQLDSPSRGFSFNQDGPLDMRMDLRNKTTALKVIEKYSEPRLAEIFQKYGELKQTRRLAREIASLRKADGLNTTSQLRQLVERVYNWRPQKGKIHPAAKVFQALRIEVNQELRDLGAFLVRTARMSCPSTRLVAICFESLEDRIIKHTFLGLASPEQDKPILRILTKKPVTATEEEITSNPRSHSAKLRAAERI
jgi:16S rRNA (cytosine1402-N4)-methyltransferase